MRSCSRTTSCFRSLLTISAPLVTGSEGPAQATATLLGRVVDSTGKGCDRSDMIESLLKPIRT